MSAQLDGETEVMPSDEVDVHLAECASCRAWQVNAAKLTRTLRVRAAEPTPDLASAVIAQVPGSKRRWPVLRIALGSVAAAQILLGIFQALGFTLHGPGGPPSEHLLNESTAWNVAVGIGLAWAAFRVRDASGLLPMLSGFLLVLIGFSVYDLITGAVQVDRVASHGLILIGICLLYSLHRQQRREGDPHPDLGADPSTHVPTPSPRRFSPSALRRTRGQQPNLKPSAYRRAA